MVKTEERYRRYAFTYCTERIRTSGQMQETSAPSLICLAHPLVVGLITEVYKFKKFREKTSPSTPPAALLVRMTAKTSDSDDTAPTLEFTSSDGCTFKVPAVHASASRLWSSLVRIDSISRKKKGIQLTENSVVLEPLFRLLNPTRFQVVPMATVLEMMDLADKYEISSIAKLIEWSTLFHEASNELFDAPLDQDQLFKLFRFSNTFALGGLKSCVSRLIIGLNSLLWLQSSELPDGITEIELRCLKKLQHEWDVKRTRLINSFDRKSHGALSHTGCSTIWYDSQRNLEQDLKSTRVPLSKTKFLDKITGAYVGMCGGCPSCGHLTACNSMHLHQEISDAFFQIEYEDDDQTE